LAAAGLERNNEKAKVKVNRILRQDIRVAPEIDRMWSVSYEEGDGRFALNSATKIDWQA
jgi:hypothetical protein